MQNLIFKDKTHIPFIKSGTGLVRKQFIVMLIIYFLTGISSAAQNPALPYFKQQGSAIQLYINEKPFFMRAGELGNSSASSLEYLRPFWPHMVEMHVNTILCPVYWELIEPQKDKFDFTLVDGIIQDAGKNNIKLVFLWFGSWKNSMSCYAPYWVKNDSKRFPRARSKNGVPQEILTPFNQNNLHADIKAFTALMRHIREVDSIKQTVIMIQVENEIGMLPDARDYCKSANKAFNENVPPELLAYLIQYKKQLMPELYEVWEVNGFKAEGNWEEIFGCSLATDELFMAWYYAQYTDQVTQAGKQEYNLPMYVNAALIRPGYQPGQYPSAGPLPHLKDIWHAGAPHLDFLAPDIYFKTFAEWLGKYDIPGNAVFIPEVGNDQSIANAFYAVGKHNAIGYSPFSIESITGDENNKLPQGYELLRQLEPLFLAHQGLGTMNAVLLDSASQSDTIELGDYRFIFKHEYSWRYAARTSGEKPRFGGLIIMLGPDEFIIAGSGLVVTFETRANDGTLAGIGSLDEMELTDGTLKFGRRMNGDQSHQGRHMHLPGNTFSMQRVMLYKYK